MRTSAGPSPRVLVADDDDIIRKLLATVLIRSGFEVECVRNGAEAIRKIEEASYAVVILDLMMPVVSGFEVIAHLERTAPDKLKRCVIVLTAVADPELRKLDGKDIFRLIRKPFDLSELVAAVVECVELQDQPSPRLIA